MLLKIRIFFFLLCCAGCVAGQQLNFDYYSRSNGLVNNEVHCIMQGADGFMYFGTPSGLSVFDGVTFVNYDLDKGFRHNIVSDIKELGGNELAVFTNSNQFYRIREN